MTDANGYEVIQTQGAWVVRMWWPHGPVSGGPQRIEIEPAQDAPARDVARGITTTVLRRVDLPGAVTAAEERAPGHEAAHEIAATMDRLGAAARALLEAEGVSGAYLAALATAYTYAEAHGVRAPNQWLAQSIGRSLATAKVHLRRVRSEGYLSQGPQRE